MAATRNTHVLASGKIDHGDVLRLHSSYHQLDHVDRGGVVQVPTACDILKKAFIMSSRHFRAILSIRYTSYLKISYRYPLLINARIWPMMPITGCKIAFSDGNARMLWCKEKVIGSLKCTAIIDHV